MYLRLVGVLATGGRNQSGRFMKKGAQSSEDDLIEKRLNQDGHAHLRREQNIEASLMEISQLSCEQR